MKNNQNRQHMKSKKGKVRLEIGIPTYRNELEEETHIDCCEDAEDVFGYIEVFDCQVLEEVS